MADTSIAFSIAGVDIYWYGLIITCGILAAAYLATRLSKRRGYNSDMLLDAIFLIVPLGVIGARLYYVAFSFDEFAGKLDTIFTLRMTGLSILGGVIGGAIGALIFAKWRKVSFWDIADCVAPGVALAQAMGRWGNFFNQEVYGAALNNVSMQVSEHLALAPPAVFIDATGQWHLALFLIESVWNLLACGLILYLWKRKPDTRGFAFMLYLVLYCGMRTLLEGLRTAEYQLMIGGMPVSMLSSLVAAVVALGVLVYIIRKGGFGTREIPERYRIKTDIPQAEQE